MAAQENRPLCTPCAAHSLVSVGTGTGLPGVTRQTPVCGRPWHHL